MLLTLFGLFGAVFLPALCLFGKFSEPGEGGEPPDDDDDPGDDDEPKAGKLSGEGQKIVNLILAQTKKQFRAIDKKLAVFATLGETVKELEGSLESLADGVARGYGYKDAAEMAEDMDEEGNLPPEIAGTDTDLDLDDEDAVRQDPRLINVIKKLQFDMRKMQKNQDRLVKQLEEARAESETAQSARMNSERDRLLSEALITAGCLDPEAGLVLLRGRVTWDEDEEAWVYTNADGVEITIEEGVEDDLTNRHPYLMKPATGEKGGAGTQRGAAAEKALTSLRAQVAEAKEKAEATGRNEDIVLYQGLNRQLAEAEGGEEGAEAA